ncbi:MAG: TonB-dependent receptor, partial [Pseudomonadota bacterium]
TLARTLPRTLPESLETLPGVHIQKTASGHGSPYIRGFTGNRTLAAIDGIRYNNATYRDGPNEYFSHIDTFTLSEVELISGPSSALYGSDAVGGTISLKTKGSDFSAAEIDKWFLNGRQVLRYASGDRSIISRSAIDVGRGQNWGLSLGLSVKEFGDVRAADLGRLPNTGYSERGWDARLDAVIGSDWTLTAVHQDLQQNDVPRTHSTIFSRSFEGTTVGTDLRRDKDQDRSLTYLKLTGPTSLQFADFVELVVSYQPREERERRVRGDGLDIDQAFESDLFAFNSVFQRGFERALLTYGLDLSHETIDSRRTDFDTVTGLSTERVQGPVGDDATYQQAGLFANIAWDVTDRLSIDLGARLSYVGADIGRFEDPVSGAPAAFSGDWTDFSGSARAGYSWGPNDRSMVFLSASQAFRAPNIADISRFGRSRSTEFEVASLGLQPEDFLSGEIGYRHALDALTLTAAYYYTDLRNYIETVPTGRIVDGLIEVSKQNSASGRIHGVELTGALQLPAGFDLSGNATWTEGDLT